MTATVTPDDAASRPKRRGLVVGLIVSGAVLIALIVGGVVWGAIQTSAHTPQAAARPYLDALVKGDVAAAVRAGHITTQSPLVTQTVYSTTADRVTGYSIRPLQTTGDQASVIVAYVQGGHRATQILRVQKTGTELFFFARWALEPVRLPTLRVAIDGPARAVTVNGANVQVDGGGASQLAALPGRYDISVAGNVNVTGDKKSATVAQLQSTGRPAGAVALQVGLTDAGKSSGAEAVNAWVAACIAQPVLEPDGCSFALTNSRPDLTLSNAKWTLTAAPAFQVGPWDGHGWRVATTAPGSATFRADFSDADGSSGTVSSRAPVPVVVAGEITGFDKEGKAVFRSIDWSGRGTQADT